MNQQQSITDKRDIDTIRTEFSFFVQENKNSIISPIEFRPYPKDLKIPKQEKYIAYLAKVWKLKETNFPPSFSLHTYLFTLYTMYYVKSRIKMNHFLI